MQTGNFAKKTSSPLQQQSLAVVAEAEDALVSCLLQSAADAPRSRRTMGGKHRHSQRRPVSVKHGARCVVDKQGGNFNLLFLCKLPSLL